EQIDRDVGRRLEGRAVLRPEARGRAEAEEPRLVLGRRRGPGLVGARRAEDVEVPRDVSDLEDAVRARVVGQELVVRDGPAAPGDPPALEEVLAHERHAPAAPVVRRAPELPAAQAMELPGPDPAHPTAIGVLELLRGRLAARLEE